MQAAYRVSLGGLRPAPRRPRPTCPRVHVSTCAGAAASQRELCCCGSARRGPAPHPPAQRGAAGTPAGAAGGTGKSVLENDLPQAQRLVPRTRAVRSLQSRPVSAPCPHPPPKSNSYHLEQDLVFRFVLRNKENSALSCYSSVSSCLLYCFLCVQSSNDSGWSCKWLQLERGYS